MKIDIEMDLEPIFDTILNKSENLIRNGKKIPNERVFHHMFSSYVYSHFSKKNVDIWESLLLVPEHETDPEYATHKKSINKDNSPDVKYAREEGRGKGRGNFDFALKSEPQIFIEFKGPKLYTVKEICEVLLKLLAKDKSRKVFTAIITSSKTGNKNHIHEIEDRFIKGLKSALKELKIESIKDINLYLYVATILLDNKPITIFWGNAKDEKMLIEKDIS